MFLTYMLFLRSFLVFESLAAPVCSPIPFLFKITYFFSLLRHNVGVLLSAAAPTQLDPSPQYTIVICDRQHHTLHFYSVVEILSHCKLCFIMNYLFTPFSYLYLCFESCHCQLLLTWSLTRDL